MKRLSVILAFFTVLSVTIAAQEQPGGDLKDVFDNYGVDGCFVLYDQVDDTYVRCNPALCDSGFIPASTFKIPHSLIALEEGVVKDTNQVIPWDGHRWPAKKWNQDQTLATAVRYSCVWVFSEFTRHINMDTYNRYIRAFDYGNKNLTGRPSMFWLAGMLRISANQQVEFLRKFYNYELPVSKRSVDMVKNSIVLERKGPVTWSGKTGGGRLDDDHYIMWLTGYVEKDHHPCLYAMNFVTTDFDKYSHARYDIVKNILEKLNLME